jgi:hypothetical protein
MPASRGYGPRPGSQLPDVQTLDPTPVAPVVYPRVAWCLGTLVLEEREERGLGLDGDYAVVVEPDAAEHEAEELALGGWVGLGGPEDGEVFEHLAGLVEVRRRLGRERVQLGVDRVASGVRPLERQVIQAVKALARRPDSEILFDLEPGRPAGRQIRALSLA